MDAKIEAGESGTYDFAFNRRRQAGYPAYFEACLKLLRPGGVIAVDNVLWGGDVINDDNHEDSTKAIRAINDAISTDERVDISHGSHRRRTHAGKKALSRRS